MKEIHGYPRSFISSAMIFSLVLAVTSAAHATNLITVFNVETYGARGNGSRVETRAIQDAIDDCTESGGGMVFLPAGTYITGTIVLRDNVDLHLDAGAILRGSIDLDDYGAGTGTRALIYARDVSHISISGNGVIDGNSIVFQDTTRVKTVEPASPDYDTGQTRQGSDYMHEKFGTEDGPWYYLDRPSPSIEFDGVSHAVLRDVTITSTPSWATRIMNSDYVTVHGVDIINELMGANSDGIHITTSRNVEISDCHFEGGDDAIIVTGFGDPDAVSENVTVTNCTLKTRSSGIRVGYGESSIRNCVFSNLVIYDSNRGLGVFVRDNGSVENILFSNITIKTRLHKGHWWGNGEPIHVSVVPQHEDSHIGRLRNVRFTNITAESENGVIIHGYEDSIIEDVVLDGVRVHIRNSDINQSYGGNFDLRPTYLMDMAIFEHDIPGIFCGWADGVTLRDVKVTWDDDMPSFFSSGIEADTFSNLVIDGFTGRQANADGEYPVIALRNGETVTIRDCIAAPGSGTFVGMDALRDARLFTGNDLTDAQAAFSPSPGDFTVTGNIMP